jgi:hypothetical protein
MRGFAFRTASIVAVFSTVFMVQAAGRSEYLMPEVKEVVRIGTPSGSGTGTVFSKGILNGTAWISVITAEHVVPTNTVTMRFGASGGTAYTADPARIYRGGAGGNLDIAIAWFALDMPTYDTLTPKSLILAPGVGSTFSNLGRGNTGSEKWVNGNWVGYNNAGTYGTLRFANNSIRTINSTDMDWTNTDPRTPAAVSGEGPSWPGDSGSSYFALTPTNVSTSLGSFSVFTDGIIGIHAWGQRNADGSKDWGFISGGTPMSQPVLDWALSHAVPVPEPASMAILGLGALALMRRKRRA